MPTNVSRLIKLRVVTGMHPLDSLERDIGTRLQGR